MKVQENLLITMACVALLGVSSGNSASIPNAPLVPAKMVVTVRPGQSRTPADILGANDLQVLEGNSAAPVARLQRLVGNLADMQLFVLLDDSTRSSSLSVHLPDLKKFLTSLPDTTQVAVGYMHNGTFALAQTFTADHAAAAGALRLPMAAPGQNGSPYFALSDLVKRWPSKEPTDRRAVLMLTDGVDRYYDTAVVDDPYVDAAVHDALKEGVMVYSIYLRGAGLFGQGARQTNFAQSRLMEVSEETGGSAYFQNFSDPVSISPFLADLQDRLNNQYQVTIQANEKGVQPIKVRTELSGIKIQSPTRIYVE